MHEYILKNACFLKFTFAWMFTAADVSKTAAAMIKMDVSYSIIITPLNKSHIRLL